jgi:predicted pyridoxine 5'-phosphate oxidase superfamily flavin-nucleotide-binding protein
MSGQNQMRIQDMSSEVQAFRPTKAEVVAFLDTLPLCVLASLDGTGQPQAATVAFSQTDNLEFVVGTDESSRKALNIVNDDRVAVVVTDPMLRYTVQAEGTARKVTAEEFDAYAQRHFEKLPASAPFRDVEGQCYFVVTPQWLRFSDCNPHPWVLTTFTGEDLV